MVPSGPPTPAGGAHSVPNLLLRSSSGLVPGGIQSNAQQPLSSLAFNNSNSNGSSMSLLANMPNAPSLINQSVANGTNLQQLQQLGSTEPDPHAFAAVGGPSVNPLGADHSQPQQLNAMHRGGLGNIGDRNGLTPHQLQSLRGLGPAKMEPQHLQSMRGSGPVKMDPQYSDSPMFLQQQQQMLQMSRQSPQTAAQLNLLQQQQRILQMHQQQQQQQQLLKGLPPRNQLQHQQQLQQSMALRSQMKPNNYEPGTCSRRLAQYMYHQQHRPQDNGIEFWRKFVSEYYAPNAKKRWCVSLYGSGRQTTGVFPQDMWHCEICKRKPGRGFETTAEVLPRLCQIKYASGTLEELLYIDMPCEGHNALGQIVLDYPKAIQESVFEQLRVVRDGHLRVIFNPDLKISSWEFCARRHDELIPRRLIIPQVSQLSAVVQKYQNDAQSTSSGLSSQDLQSSCNSFAASTRQLAKALEVPLVNDLGYTKRYVRCLQISEVVNSMKDLIDYGRETGTGPMDSLINFPRRTSNSAGLHSQQQAQQLESQPLTAPPISNRDRVLASIMQITPCANIGSLNSFANGPPLTPQSTAVSGLLRHQNSMNSIQDVQLGSVGSSSSPFPPPTPTTSNNVSTMQQQQDVNDTQSSMQQIIEEMMMSSPANSVGSLGNEAKGMNGISSTYGGMGEVLRSAMVNGARSVNGRIGMNQMLQDPTTMNHLQQGQDMGNRAMGGLGSTNSFGNLHYDWKTSP